MTVPKTFPHGPPCSSALTAAKSAGGRAALGLVVKGFLSPRIALDTCTAVEAVEKGVARAVSACVG